MLLLLLLLLFLLLQGEGPPGSSETLAATRSSTSRTMISCMSTSADFSVLCRTSTPPRIPMKSAKRDMVSQDKTQSYSQTISNGESASAPVSVWSEDEGSVGSWESTSTKITRPGERDGYSTGSDDSPPLAIVRYLRGKKE